MDGQQGTPLILTRRTESFTIQDFKNAIATLENLDKKYDQLQEKFSQSPATAYSWNESFDMTHFLGKTILDMLDFVKWGLEEPTSSANNLTEYELKTFKSLAQKLDTLYTQVLNKKYGSGQRLKSLCIALNSSDFAKALPDKPKQSRVRGSKGSSFISV
jgi:hypothetical protein